ncbi:MAG: tyrosine-type recombinase/integrase [Planctomycetes bacterium]|nr:tyrosine-type recombinase/integrase [Planctomycetota bacterium]
MALVRKMFKFAVSRDILTSSPCVAIDKPALEKPRDRVLSSDEIKKFLNRLSSAHISQLNRLVFQLQLCTAQRCGEVISITWHEIDLKNRIWTIPSEVPVGLLRCSFVPPRCPPSPFSVLACVRVRIHVSACPSFPSFLASFLGSSDDH